MKKSLLLIVLMIFGWVGVASAVPVQFAGNGHWYDVVTTDPDGSSFNGKWKTANYYSDDFSYLGETSYFATITSAEENAFVASLLDTTAYLGGLQNWSISDNSAPWYWAATGEVFSYMNWAPGEPNDAGFWGEDFLEMYTSGLWNDVKNNDGNMAYVVEFDGAAPVPEPGTLLLLGSGLAGLALYRRKKAAK